MSFSWVEGGERQDSSTSIRFWGWDFLIENLPSTSCQFKLIPSKLWRGEEKSSWKSHYLQCGLFGVHFIPSTLNGKRTTSILGNFAADVSTTVFIMLKIARRIEIHAIKIYLKTKLRRVRADGETFSIILWHYLRTFYFILCVHSFLLPLAYFFFISHRNSAA